jgi:hypothetical protein
MAKKLAKKSSGGSIMKTAGKTTTGVVSDYQGFKGKPSVGKMEKGGATGGTALKNALIKAGYKKGGSVKKK